MHKDFQWQCWNCDIIQRGIIKLSDHIDWHDSNDPYDHCRTCLHNERLSLKGYCDCPICWNLQIVNHIRDKFGANGYDKRSL